MVAHQPAAADCCVCAFPDYHAGVLCGRHMRSLPERLTRALIDTCDRGQSPPSAEHLAVVAEAARHG